MTTQDLAVGSLMLGSQQVKKMYLGGLQVFPPGENNYTYIRGINSTSSQSGNYVSVPFRLTGLDVVRFKIGLLTTPSSNYPFTVFGTSSGRRVTVNSNRQLIVDGTGYTSATLKVVGSSSVVEINPTSIIVDGKTVQRIATTTTNDITDMYIMGINGSTSYLGFKLYYFEIVGRARFTPFYNTTKSKAALYESYSGATYNNYSSALYIGSDTL